MSIQSNLAVMRNPFSTATTTPKVCDGKLGHSVGVREGTAFQVADEGGEIVFILYPGLTSSVCTMTNALLSPVVTDYPNSIDSQAFTGGVKANDNPDRFRLVSAGMRVTCINNAENNNGWFEAIRVPIGFSFSNATGSVFDTVLRDDQPVINPFLENELYKDTNSWANHPSYVTGKLRNLEKHMFYLQPTGDREVNLLASGSDMFDKNFDIIMLRIHAAASEDTTQKLTCMCHVVSNWEYNYDAGNVRSRYHSPSYNNAMAVLRNDKFIKRDPKASTIRNASSYGYSFR